MCPPPSAVIFDLDGTLVQTREASWKVFAAINDAHGLGIDTAEKFFGLFADNFFASLREVCGTTERADRVVGEFMSALDEHYAPMMVPGLADVVKQMVPQSRLAVLSSNTTAVIRRVLRSNHLEYCFAHVFGGDVEPDKGRGIERFLSDAAVGSGRLCTAYYDEPTGDTRSAPNATANPREVALITDTVGDVEAAVASGIRAVGVAWGMHTEEQLLAAGAEFVAIWPQELLSYLYGRVDDACSCSVAVVETATAQQDRVVRNRRLRRLRGIGNARVPAGAPQSPPPKPPAPARDAQRTTTLDPVLADAIARTIR
ncbi:HAD family hydrolase [Gordonia sp. TBRC 11910]|uniref:HAD family hydrolase n=1 Tax=Gordonia asplenii TaxID=2725283 RepID=A0A848L019_9ACTN|nr:HAD hydrolase-like protein [Gordonia asplenii]NMO03777.1 HAD family hydrolase [Gordonia asplenii]